MSNDFDAPNKAKCLSFWKLCVEFMKAYGSDVFMRRMFPQHQPVFFLFFLLSTPTIFSDQLLVQYCIRLVLLNFKYLWDLNCSNWTARQNVFIYIFFILIVQEGIWRKVDDETSPWWYTKTGWNCILGKAPEFKFLLVFFNYPWATATLAFFLFFMFSYMFS